MLILGMMNNKEQRLTVKQIKVHPFFRNFDWKTVKERDAPMIPKIENEVDTNNFDSFEEEDKWIEDHSVERRTHHERARASSAEVQRFNYPGFEFIRTPDVDIFDTAHKEIMVLTR